MTVELVLTLVVLALVDSLSLGTLLVPLFLLLAPAGPRVGRVAVYLATIAIFSLAAGTVLMLGAVTALDRLHAVGGTRPLRIAQLVVGGGLFVWSFLLGRKKGGATSGRLVRWRDRAMTEGASAVPLVLLALGAGLVEIATMVPYLGAVTLLTSSGLADASGVGVLAGYCAVMVLPAVVLLAVRIAAGHRVEPVLRRTVAWMERSAADSTAWAVGIVGFLVARDAAWKLGLFGAG